MTKIHLKDGKWVNEKDEFVGEIVQISPREFGIKQQAGDIKHFQLGRIDSEGNFYSICYKSYLTCAQGCTYFRSKVCRYNFEMSEIAYYMFD